MVLLLSQPRIMFAMAREASCPEFFGPVHPRFRTPWKGTIVTGSAVALMGSLLPLRILAELTNIGTLLAFVIVAPLYSSCAGLNPGAERPFRCPLVPQSRCSELRSVWC